jgi:hypothetical protein
MTRLSVEPSKVNVNCRSHSPNSHTLHFSSIWPTQVSEVGSPFYVWRLANVVGVIPLSHTRVSRPKPTSFLLCYENDAATKKAYTITIPFSHQEDSGHVGQ